MNQIFIDTSAWYAFLNKKDPHHSSIRTFFEKTTLMLATSNFIVAELFNLLVSRRQKRLAVQFGEQLRHRSAVMIHAITSLDENEAWKIFCKYSDQDFSFTDCSSFAQMQRLRIEQALTLDDDFKMMGFQGIS